VLEYITETFGKPNPGFERHPRYLEDRERHKSLAGRLIAVHRLRPSSRPLLEILGADEFNGLQDIWDQGGKRSRWSVAFPIVESFEIIGHPRAKEVFSQESYSRVYQHSSGTLRPLNDSEREQLAHLELRPLATTNSWIAIEDEILAAERSEIRPSVISKIYADLDRNALEGLTEERRAKVKLRAAWLANSFVLARQRQGTFWCDACRFDPAHVIHVERLATRRLLDVHHKNPLAEGVRYTTSRDFALLCPTCHRLEHMLLRKGASLFEESAKLKELVASRPRVTGA
jgi:5-methylcytosine-specific restriction protein A